MLVLSLSTAGFCQSTPTASPMGSHSMSGQVTSIDTKKGWIHLKTAEGTMIMHFPPQTLAGVKKGDRLTVELGLTDSGPAPKTK
jgi:hypothetical protein